MKLAVGAMNNDGRPRASPWSPRSWRAKGRKAAGTGETQVHTGQVRVYEFDQSSSDWVQMGGDIDGEAKQDHFGLTVSLSEDGLVLAAGSKDNSDNGTRSGHVRVFAFDTTSRTWAQRGQDIDGKYAGEESGFCVSLSSNGDTVAVGAWTHSTKVAEYVGCARAFKFTDGSWLQLGNDLVGEAARDLFGSRVSLSGDGRVMAVSAIGNDNNGEDSGSVRIFGLSGAAWAQLGDDINGNVAGGCSGCAVSLSGDGSTVAIGAHATSATGYGATGQDNPGTVRVYKWQAPPSWWEALLAMFLCPCVEPSITN